MYICRCIDTIYLKKSYFYSLNLILKGLMILLANIVQWFLLFSREIIGFIYWLQCYDNIIVLKLKVTLKKTCKLKMASYFYKKKSTFWYKNAAVQNFPILPVLSLRHYVKFFTQGKWCHIIRKRSFCDIQINILPLMWKSWIYWICNGQYWN